MSNVALNPFLFDNRPVQDDARGPCEYAIVRRGDATTPDVERADAEVLEVTLRWGRTVLGITYLALGGDLSIGEDDGGAILVPEKILGTRSFKLIDKGTLAVPPNATSDVSGRVELAKGARARIAMNVAAGEEQTMTLQVARLAAGRTSPRRSSMKKGIFAALAGTFLAHVVAVAALSFAPGASLAVGDQPMDKETEAYLNQLQHATAIKEIVPQEATEQAGQGGGLNGGAHSGDTGQSGDMSAPSKNAAYALKAPAESTEEHLAHVRTLIESNNYLALGALQTVFGGMNKGPIDAASQWDNEVGHEPLSANGHITGDELGDAYGSFGLGEIGNGPGGGGFGDHLGMNTIGPFGHGPGGGGFNSGSGCAGPFSTCGAMPPGAKTIGHTGGGLKPLTESADIAGGLPPEVVRRIVRANFPRFGQCYEQGLKKDPSLEGTVTTRFIIDETGAVEAVQVASGTSDAAVDGCVASIYSTLSFPIPTQEPGAPPFGKARVTYSINFGHQ